MHLIRLRDPRPDSALWHGAEVLVARVPARGEQLAVPGGSILTVSAVLLVAFDSTPFGAVLAEITVH